jgi:hypothetical protein
VFASHINGQGSEETKLTGCISEECIDLTFLLNVENTDPLMAANFKSTLRLICKGHFLGHQIFLKSIKKVSNYMLISNLVRKL